MTEGFFYEDSKLSAKIMNRFTFNLLSRCNLSFLYVGRVSFDLRGKRNYASNNKQHTMRNNKIDRKCYTSQQRGTLDVNAITLPEKQMKCK